MNELNTEAEKVSPARPRSKRKLIVVTVIIVCVVIVIAAIAVWLATPGTPIRLTVSLSPESPEPYEPFTVTAQVDGGGPLSPIDVMLDFESYANGSSGGGGFTSHSGNQWSRDFEGFPDGSEAWIIIAAATANQAPVFEHLTLRIGTVLHGGPSGLAISNTVRTPEQPDSLDTISVSARVTSAANISRVILLARSYFWSFGFLGSSFSGGGGGGPMFEGSPGNYSLALNGISPPGPGGGGTERGTIWVYRIAAWDGTWNTAVTSVETFTIS